jgi:hypothetical protein
MPIIHKPPEMVTSALEMVLGRDADFHRWPKQQQAAGDQKDGPSAAKAARA